SVSGPGRRPPAEPREQSGEDTRPFGCSRTGPRTVRRTARGPAHRTRSLILPSSTGGPVRARRRQLHLGGVRIGAHGGGTAGGLTGGRAGTGDRVEEGVGDGPARTPGRRSRRVAGNLSPADDLRARTGGGRRSTIALRGRRRTAGTGTSSGHREPPVE